MFTKIQYVNLLKKYIKWGVGRVAVCPSYIQDAQFLKVKETTWESVVRVNVVEDSKSAVS
jgi:hypothetical protein